MDIFISSSSTQSINLSEYAASSLSITVQPGVHYSCIYNQINTQVTDISFYVGKDATLQCALLLTQGEHTTLNLAVFLDSPYAHATIRGVYALNGSQKLNITTSQHHRAPHTTSSLIIKGMLNERAYADYRGTILVDQVARFTTAVQENKNMLLSRAARAHSVPSLEVLTNDVHCKHGSAVGYLDDQLLFYVQAHGLDEQIARQLLLHGFFREIIDTLDATVVSGIYEIIEEKVSMHKLEDKK